jgi:hypothetical protein
MMNTAIRILNRSKRRTLPWRSRHGKPFGRARRGRRLISTKDAKRVYAARCHPLNPHLKIYHAETHAANAHDEALRIAHQIAVLEASERMEEISVLRAVSP